MSNLIQITVPDIGDFTDVDIIELHVSSGDEVAAEDSLITLETEKAAMDVPAPYAGKIGKVNVKLGDKVSQGDLIVEIFAIKDEPSTLSNSNKPEESVTKEPLINPEGSSYEGKVDLETDLLVLGAGPGGYTAAFRASDLGVKTILVDRWPSLGGVCLNVGCIPSKALLHAAKVIEEADAMSDFGVRFNKPEIDTAKLVDWKQGVVNKLTTGLTGLAKRRNVDIIQGEGTFISANHLSVKSEKGAQIIAFKSCIIASGSEPAMLPGLPEDPRIIDSTGALELKDIPGRMLVIGGGIIGLEMATVYDALGVKVTVVELTDSLIPDCDPDLIRPLEKRIKKRYEAILKGVRVEKIIPEKAGLMVSFSGNSAPDAQLYDKVLVAVGRAANGNKIGLDQAGVNVDKAGIIPVNKQMLTNVPNIYAIGDIVGQPMLAHKATHEGKVAAEVVAGKKAYFDARSIPGVAYTDPEIAWTGITETEAKAKGIDYGIGKFPWAASGRSLSLGRDDGVTKLVFDNKTNKIIGAGIVGPNAGELIAEACLAIEMGCDASDIGLTVHPHPTLSETVAMGADAFDGTLTDLYMPKLKKD
ncbi:MAG: dihydrolipoyl dehydrogenase [Pseudomonadota bacterium]|nr:dihydrolipoyl dehydrogenase [Pseudomonadota bacterium]